MTIYAGIFIGNYAKNMNSQEHSTGTSMSQMELLRTKGTRFCGILQSSVIPRLKLDNQILFLLIKSSESLAFVTKVSLLCILYHLLNVSFQFHSLIHVKASIKLYVSIYQLVRTTHLSLSGPYSVRMRENTDQKQLCIWTLFTHCIVYQYYMHFHDIKT